MRHFSIVTLLILLAGTALAQDNATPRKFTEEPARTQIDNKAAEAPTDLQDAKAQQAKRTAMNEEINLRITAEKDAVTLLTARLETALTSEARLELQGQISAAKQKGWRDVLAIQLKYAELGGHTAQAEDLRARVARLDEGLSPTQSANQTAKSASTRGSSRSAGGVK